MTYAPLTKTEIAQGRMRNYKITVTQTGWGEPMTVDIAAVSAERALSILATRMADPNWLGPDWTMDAA